MGETTVVEIGSGDAATCSRRIFQAFKSKSLQTLARELTRAERVCRHTGGSSLADEQAELLDAIVGKMRVSINQHQPCAEAEISLLGHLAGSAARLALPQTQAVAYNRHTR